MQKKPKKSVESWKYKPVPSSARRLFRMAWQLESWLRTIVYVELRAQRVDWEEPIKKAVNNWPPHPQTKDKELTHMITHHQGVLSYLTFGELWKIISHKDNWPFFETYFPPEANTSTKIEEVRTIRNRVAHFREPHKYDEARFRQFLQDVEGGVRRFCNRYTTGCFCENDPVVEKLEDSWENIGYGYEMLCLDERWLYAPGDGRIRPQMHAKLKMLAHDRYTKGSHEGVIYRLEISPSLDRRLNVADFLSSTHRLHGEIIHIFVKSENEVAITIPALCGDELTVQLIKSFLSAGINCSHSSLILELDEARSKWPEYVLWPGHILSFYDHEMRGDILEIPNS